MVHSAAINGVFPNHLKGWRVIACRVYFVSVYI